MRQAARACREDLLFDPHKRYGITEAARIWGCNRNTLYRLAKHHPGMLVESRTRARWLLDGAELNRVYYG